MCHSSDIPLKQIVQLVRQFPILIVKAVCVTSIPLVRSLPHSEVGTYTRLRKTDPVASLAADGLVQPMSVQCCTNFHRESATRGISSWKILCPRTPGKGDVAFWYKSHRWLGVLEGH